jgi:hypothetical protein
MPSVRVAEVAGAEEAEHAEEVAEDARRPCNARLVVSAHSSAHSNAHSSAHSSNVRLAAVSAAVWHRPVERNVLRQPTAQRSDPQGAPTGPTLPTGLAASAPGWHRPVEHSVLRQATAQRSDPRQAPTAQAAAQDPGPLSVLRHPTAQAAA